MENAESVSSPTASVENSDTPKKAGLFANPATAKGLVLLIAGSIALLAPRATTPIVGLACALALVIWGLTEVWEAIRHWRDVGFIGLLLAVISIGAGVGLLLNAYTPNFLLIVAGFYLLARGLVGIVRLVINRKDEIAVRATAALLQISLGIVLFEIPRTAALALVGVGALVAISVGSIFLYHGIRRGDEVSDLNAANFTGICKRWLAEHDLGFTTRNEIAEGLYFEEPDKREKLRSWWTMLSLSVLIATFGILQDSTAVVIGAMLIAPLMTPILGAAGAVVNGRRRRLLSSLTLVLLGAGVSIFLAFAVGRWTPDLIQVETNSQIVSRVSPNLIDMGIALAAGAAGAFASVNRRAAGSIAGVAIAVALVPPLGVVGLTLEIGEFGLAGGAFLLFLANFIAILLAASLVFVAGGWVSVRRLRAHINDVYVTTGLVGATAMVVMVPLLFAQQGVVSQAQDQAIATGVVDRWVDATDLDLAVKQVEFSDGTVTVRIEGSDPFPDPDSLGAELTKDLGRAIDLDVFLTPTQAIRYRTTVNE